MSELSAPRNFPIRRVNNFQSSSAWKLRAGTVSTIDLTSHDFTAGVAAALREDYGDTDSMVKRICQDTGASMGTVKNWLAESNGPGGEHLLKLMAASPAVRAFTDRVTRRNDAAAEADKRLRRALAIMEGREEP